MTNFAPYIITAVVAMLLLAVIWYQARAARKSTALFEARLADLEHGFSEIETAAREEIRKSAESTDLKMIQLREELRTTLESFVEATGNKLAENTALQKNRFDQLSERVAALGRMQPRGPEPKPEPKPEPRPEPRPAPKPAPRPEPKQNPEPSPPPRPEPPAQAPAPRQSPAHDKAKRLARLIVADIVLYNQAAVEEGVRKNTLAELLAHDIQEARALYAQRVPEEIRSGTSYLEDAFRELIVRKKRELNIA